MSIIKLLLGAYILISATHVIAAPYAATVVNEKTGEILHCENCDVRQHPAGLTKLLTLYIAFEAIESGEVGLDDHVTISQNSASEPPLKIGLRSGQKIKLRYLLRGAGVAGANDAATAIAEYISGSEARFARRMNETSKRLGMTRSTWKNAHGLTQSGHLSTAIDMAILVQAHRRDFPEFYNLFSRITDDAGIRQVTNSGRRYLANKHVDFFKHGYTRAAGFNGAAVTTIRKKSAITIVFGGRSTASRDAQIFQLTQKYIEVMPANGGPSMRPALRYLFPLENKRIE